MEVNDGELPTVVVDATGNVHSMSGCLQFAAATGRVGYVGITTDEVHFPHPLMHAKELTLYACRNSLPKDFARIIRLIEDGTIDTRPWITHRTTFDTVVDEFVQFTKPETGVIKAIIEMPD
jgi:alcohol dehydrogenase